MLRKEFRLKKNKDFRKVFNHGKVIPSRFLVIYYKPNYDQKLRIGLSVSKKLGGAVTRNRIKRILREILRKHLSRMNSGLDLIFIARASVKGIRSCEVEDSLVKILKKHQLMR